MKRVLCLLICLVMILALSVGCGSSNTEKQAASSTASQAGTTAGSESTTAAPAAEKPKPITFTMFRSTANPGQDLNSETPIAKKVQELTGVTLEWQFPTGDFIEKVSLMAASGDLPDMIYCQEATPILYNAKCILQLDDYIEKFGQNVKKLYGEDVLKMARWSLEDMHNYYLPTGGVKEEMWTDMDYDAGFLLQLAACKALNYPKINTLADYENAIKTYYEQNKTINGQPAIPYSLNLDSWHGIFSVLNPIGYACGDNGDDGEYRIDLVTHKAQFRYTLPIYKEGYRWYNHMNSIGLIDPESFVQKFDQYQAKIAQGRVIACNDVISWHINQAIDSLKAANMVDRTYAQFCPSVDGKVGYNSYMKPMWTARDGVMITTKCKDPERAFKFLDWLCTDEAQVLNHWGIEGTDYTIKDGKRIWSDDYWSRNRNSQADFGKATGIGNFGWPFPERAKGTLDANGDYYQPFYGDDKTFENKPQAEKDVLTAYGIKLWKGFYPDRNKIPTNTWGFGWTLAFPTDSKGALADKTCMDIVYKDVPKLILCKPSEFDAKWDAFQKELQEAGVEIANLEKTVEVEKISRLYTQ